MIEFLLSILISWNLALMPVFIIMTIYCLKNKDPHLLFGNQSQQTFQKVEDKK